MKTMNPLEAYESLKKVKFTEAQSKELTRLLSLFYDNEPVTKRELSETELRLINSIEEIRKETQAIRKEMKEIDFKLTKEIKDLDFKLTKEIKDLDFKLTKEIKDIETKLEIKIEQVRSDLIRWMSGLLFVSVGLIVGLIKFIH